jgi:hypothetical protein
MPTICRAEPASVPITKRLSEQVYRAGRRRINPRKARAKAAYGAKNRNPWGPAMKVKGM